MATSTVENYVKQLYLEQQRAHDGRAARDAELIPLGRLATALDVVPGTVTTMVRALADARLVRYEPRNGVRLTAAGEKLALHVLRRHRLVELFLVKVIGYDWSEVHEEAEELEHVVSDKLLERMDALLGRPSVDPHGDPIPSAEGHVASRPMQRLSACAAGARIRVERVDNQDARFLRMVDELGLLPGSQHELVRNDAVAGTLTLRSAAAPGRESVIGTRAAESILIVPAIAAASTDGVAATPARPRRQAVDYDAARR